MWRKIIISLFLILLVVGTLFQIYMLPPSNIYIETNNLPSKLDGHAKHLLTLGGKQFVWDYTEAPLDSTVFWLGKPIGKTNSELTVHKIRGQNPNDYILVSGFMFPEMIYRSVSIPPVKIEDLTITEILHKKYIGTSVFGSKTSNSNITQELITYIRNSKSSKVKKSNIEDEILVITRELKGIGYRFGIQIDNNKVFIGIKYNTEWIEAGPILSKWILDQI